MNNRLPETFVNRMRQQLGSELPAFLCALDEPPLRGIRINPLKRTDTVREWTDGEPVPWAADALYLPEGSNAGATVLHEAGAFYIQEPSAMLPAAVLDARPGETVLDLCAAPGGKSTQIGCAMNGEGLLVCNEPVPKRAGVLSSNIERIGLTNTIVTCAWPDRLAEQWPEGFDAVLADAPCSGEGMFRRDPETRAEWSESKAAGCAGRQREILAAAAGMVRPGGRLVYSTCTYNTEENEGNADWFLDTFSEFHPEPFSLPGINAPDGRYTCYPHRVRGEGQFTALFRKAGCGEARLFPDRSVPAAGREEKAALGEAFPMFPAATHRFGHLLVHMPACPDLEGIKVLRMGLHLGEVRGKVIVPDHAAAMSIRTESIQESELTPEEAVRYMAGETIDGPAEGWTLIRYRGLALGWGKGSSGMIRNHYPKGIRKQHLIP